MMVIRILTTFKIILQPVRLMKKEDMIRFHGTISWFIDINIQYGCICFHRKEKLTGLAGVA